MICKCDSIRRIVIFGGAQSHYGVGSSCCRPLQCGNTPTAHTVSTVATPGSLRSCDLGTQCTTNTLLILQLWGSARVRVRACVRTEEEEVHSREKLRRTPTCVRTLCPIFSRCHHITLVSSCCCCCQADDNSVVTLLIYDNAVTVRRRRWLEIWWAIIMI